MITTIYFLLMKKKEVFKQHRSIQYHQSPFRKRTIQIREYKTPSLKKITTFTYKITQAIHSKCNQQSSNLITWLLLTCHIIPNVQKNSKEACHCSLLFKMDKISGCSRLKKIRTFLNKRNNRNNRSVKTRHHNKSNIRIKRREFWMNFLDFLMRYHSYQ